MRLSNYLSECMVEFQGTEVDFGRAFCVRCSQPECERSLVNHGETAAKLKRKKQLSQFVRAENVPRKPLPVVAQQIADSEVVEKSVLPEGQDEPLVLEERGDRLVHSVPPDTEVNDGGDLPNIGAQLAATRQELQTQKPEPEPAPQLPPQLPPVPNVTTQPDVEQDPWSLPPSSERQIDYREKPADEDPWSKEYKGPREIHAKPGQKITVG
jgi:hypothetical protein